MTRVLVLGDDRYRGAVAELLESSADLAVDDCDPALGDCVMYVRLEGVRYDGFVFIGYDDPVTRGALAIAAERTACRLLNGNVQKEVRTGVVDGGAARPNG